MAGLILDTSAFRAALTDLEQRQFPYAASVALNKAADAGLKAVQDEMRTVFDRPTPYAMNAFMVWRATKSTLQAAVQLKPAAESRHFLKVEDAGGARPQTGLERQLGFKLASGENIQTVIPGDNAKLDAFGNWSVGQRNQVLSALQAQSDPFANTPSSGARRRKRAPSLTYFIPTHGLHPGIYSRDARGRIGVILVFLDAVPVYRPRLEFFASVAAAVQSVFPEAMAAALIKAVATARP